MSNRTSNPVTPKASPDVSEAPPASSKGERNESIKTGSLDLNKPELKGRKRSWSVKWKKKQLRKLFLGSREIRPGKDENRVEGHDTGNTLFTFVLGCYFFKAFFGPMIIGMPLAFYSGGLFFSSFFFIGMILIIRWNVKKLVHCANFLSLKEKRAIKTFDDIAFVSCRRSYSPKMKSLASCFKFWVNISYFSAYSLGFLISITFLAININLVLQYFCPESFINLEYSFVLQIPFVMCLCSIRNIKYVAPFSFAASSILLLEIALTAVYLSVDGVPAIYERKYIGTPRNLVRFISTVLFAMSGFSMTLSVRSSLKNPSKFFISAGLYDWCLVAYGISFISFGFFGYLKYGERSNTSIFLDPRSDNYFIILIKVSSVLSVVFTTPLVFETCFGSIWNSYLVKKCNNRNAMWAEIFSRYFLVGIFYSIAIMYPNLYLLVIFKGAFCHSYLELILPAVLNYITFYSDRRKGKHLGRIIRLLFFVLIGFLFSVSGALEIILSVNNIV